jgi:hypothetical protein
MLVRLDGPRKTQIHQTVLDLRKYKSHKRLNFVERLFREKTDKEIYWVEDKCPII